MLLSKRRTISTLFLLGLPCYGVGFWFGAKQSFTVGMLVSLVPFITIVLLHGLDILYRGHSVRAVNRNYWLGMACLASMASGMWIAYFRGFPGYSLLNTTVQTLMLIVPFNAAVITQIVNRDDEEYDFQRSFFNSLMVLMVINYVAYAAGMHNLTHSFPGRLSLPFMRGLYDAAHLLSVLNLMLMFRIGRLKDRPVAFTLMLGLYFLQLVMMLSVNSRLSFLVFLVLTVMVLLRVLRNVRYLFPVSLFTLPLLLSFSLLIYQVLTLPPFASLLSRVSKEDVTTFNGRSYIWYGAWEWFTEDRSDLWFGAGYNGQYWHGMMKRIGILWDVENEEMIHMHSSFLQILMAQGLVGVLLMYACMWVVFRGFQRAYRSDGPEAPLFGAVVYFLFIWQIDIFVYGLDLGVLLFFTLFAYLSVPRKVPGGLMGPDSLPATRADDDGTGGHER